MHRYIKLAVVLLLCSICFYLLYAVSYDTHLNKPPLPGIDLSHYQGEPDWDKIKKDQLKFVFIKATQGSTIKDSKWQYNRDKARAYKIIHGYYHFFSPDSEPEAQARHFIDTVETVRGCLPPVLDVETIGNQSSDELSEKVDKWMMIVAEELDSEPIIYSSHDFFKTHLENHIKPSKLWLADYTKGYDFEKGHELIFAQYSQSGRAQGISGAVDLDWFEGTYKELRKLLCK